MEGLREKLAAVEDAAEFLEKLQSLSPEKREHMRIVFKGLIECYLRDDVRAVVVLSEDGNPYGELLTINCNDMEALGMLNQIQGMMHEIVTADAPPKEMMN